MPTEDKSENEVQSDRIRRAIRDVLRHVAREVVRRLAIRSGQSDQEESSDMRT